MHRLIALAASLVSPLIVSTALADDPPVFSQAGFDADRAAAIEQDKLHLVYATAVWCPPCQQMKKTTWIDPAVESWAGEHAIVTPLDVDDFPEKAQELRVRAMPTMMLFDGDEELGRRVGYASADDLVGWMEAGRTGEPMPEPAGMNFGGEDAEDTVRPKLDVAREMVFDGRLDDATDAYVSLWETMLDEQESYYGVRLSFMAGEMTELASVHEPARKAFTAIRDREGDKLRAGNVEWETLTDWVHLNQIIGDEAATIEWVERIGQRPEAAGTLRRFSDEITQQAASLGRWDVVALAVPDPVAEAREQMRFFDMMRQFSDIDPAEDPESLVWALRPAVIAALHADDDGQSETALVEYFDTAFGDADAWRLAFIAIASECGKLRDDHTAWIEEHDLSDRYPGGVNVFEPEF